VLFQGKVYEGAGAEENRAVTLGLAEAAEFAVQLAPRDSSDRGRLLDKSVRVGLERLVAQRVELARSVLYQAADPDEWNLEYYGHCRVGRAALGAEGLPDNWVRRCNSMDEVWVPSAFVLDNFGRSGVAAERLRVVHAGVDTQTFRPGLQPMEIPCRRGFQFLSFTDLAERRGTDLLLRAYLEEFQAGDDVALILAISECKGGKTDAEAKVAYFIEKQVGMRLEDIAQVMLVDIPTSDSERARLYAAADAFVAPERASAWGRSLMEAPAAGLPVIATRWGGHLEFLDDENAYLVDVEKVVAAAAEEELYAGSRWAEPSVEDLRRDLRRVVSDRAEAKSRALRGSEDVVAKRDWDVVIEEWLNGFRQLLW